jgi:mRNA degradation ribonuclease J1/J2
VENFDDLHFFESLEIRKIKGERLDPVIIHGNSIPIERERISERRKISCNGGVFLSLTPNNKLKKIDRFEFSTLGLPAHFHNNEEQFKTFLTGFFDQNKINDPEKFKEEVRVAIRRYCDVNIGYKPTTIVHLVTV